MLTRITGGHTLRPDGEMDLEPLVVDRDTIVEPDRKGGRHFDAGGCYLLPGIIDFHGDAFERVLMPRQGALMPFTVGLAETDRQLIANGITTAYLSMSYTWEKHSTLRNDHGAVKVMDAFHDMRRHLLCDVRLHLRFEIYHLNGVDTVRKWLESGYVDLLAYNDHLAYYEQKVREPDVLRDSAARLKVSTGDVAEMLAGLKVLEPRARTGVLNLSGIARRRDIPMASHDEEDVATRRWYHEAGCYITEFPCNRDAAREALRLGDHVVLGAPNALKGGSLYSRLSVREAVAEDLCTIMASDYYYPAPLQAVFLLVDLGVCSLARGWDMISANLADALRLSDRGRLEPGKRADIVLVRPANGQCPPRVVATFVGGRLAFASAEFLSHNAQGETLEVGPFPRLSRPSQPLVPHDVALGLRVRFPAR